MKKLEELTQEEVNQQVMEALNKLGTLDPRKSFILNVPEIKGLCKLCNEERDEDLVAHGPGVSVFMYYPCKHKVTYTHDEESWEE